MFDKDRRGRSSYDGSSAKSKMRAPPSHFSPVSESSEEDEDECIEDRPRQYDSPSKKSTPGKIFGIKDEIKKESKPIENQTAHTKTPDKFVQNQMMPKLATGLDQEERDYIILFANDFMHKAPNEYKRGGSISRDMFMPILMKQMIKLHPE